VLKTALQAGFARGINLVLRAFYNQLKMKR